MKFARVTGILIILTGQINARQEERYPNYTVHCYEVLTAACRCVGKEDIACSHRRCHVSLHRANTRVAMAGD